MLPKLYKKRLDEAGIDFGIVYGTQALSVLRIGDDEMRPVIYRAMNTMYADMFNDLSYRLTPAALIPMHKPKEAIDELELVVNELKDEFTRFYGLDIFGKTKNLYGVSAVDTKTSFGRFLTSLL